MRLPANVKLATTGSTKLSRMRPASGPSTWMCASPEALVAAIFPPITAWPATSGSEAWIAWPVAGSFGRSYGGKASVTVPDVRQVQSRRAAVWSVLWARVDIAAPGVGQAACHDEVGCQAPAPRPRPR
jgi:hypothetical protein